MTKSFGRPGGGSVDLDATVLAQIEAVSAALASNPDALSAASGNTGLVRRYSNPAETGAYYRVNYVTDGTAWTVTAVKEDDPTDVQDLTASGIPETWELIAENVVPDVTLSATVDMAAGDAIPTVFATDVKFVFIEIDNMNADLDLSSWVPTASADVLNIQFRKVDASSFGIVWNDPNGIPYPHVDRQGEFISFVWDSVSTTLSIT